MKKASLAAGYIGCAHIFFFIIVGFFLDVKTIRGQIAVKDNNPHPGQGRVIHRGRDYEGLAWMYLFKNHPLKDWVAFADV